MLRRDEGVLTGNVEFIKTDIMQEHIDTAEVIGRDIDLLSVEAVADGILAENFFSLQKQRAGATGGS